MSFDPAKQDQSYHDFADKRAFFEIPNFFDVITNISFAVFGFIGLYYCIRKKQSDAPWSWIVFFFGVTFVCFGSGNYHLSPDNNTLVWDRLPITVGFMGFFIALLSEYIHPKIEKYFLLPAILLGISSILYWHYLDDLRYYIWIQYIPLLCIPIIMLVFKSNYSHQRYIIFALICYFLAKVTEFYDKEIFAFMNEQLSGHSLKHIFATLAALSLYIMLKHRNDDVTNRLNEKKET
jgi:hypothetical protein